MSAVSRRKTTSPRVATKASGLLRSQHSHKTVKSVAASDLAQARGKGKKKKK